MFWLYEVDVVGMSIQPVGGRGFFKPGSMAKATVPSGPIPARPVAPYPRYSGTNTQDTSYRAAGALLSDLGRIQLSKNPMFSMLHPTIRLNRPVSKKFPEILLTTLGGEVGEMCFCRLL